MYVRTSWIKNNTDAGLHVVIELVEGYIYTMTLCVCVYVRKTLEAGSLVVLSTHDNAVSYLISTAYV